MLTQSSSMYFNKYGYIIISAILISSFGIFQIAVAQPNSTSKTFEDKKTGITLQYPSDWQIASKEYMDSIFGNMSGKTNAIVMLLPESLNGATFSIVSEILPFPMSSDKYMELTKKNSFSDPSNQIISNITSTHVGNLNGFKYLASFNGSYNQTQIVSAKGSTGFVIGYNTGNTNQSKELDDINSIVDSIKIK